MSGPASKQRKTALVTASYAADFERFRLLCETVDAYVSGSSHHYVLVQPGDLKLFKQMETRDRTVLDERDILPKTLWRVPDPKTFGKRVMWVGSHSMPLYGWHVQQMRRIAIAFHVREEGLVYCDSDVCFVKPLDLATFWVGSDMTLYRRKGALADGGETDRRHGHDLWVRSAARLLGAPNTLKNDNDHISTVIGWRADTTRAMCAHIEAETGLNWMTSLARARQFSECMLYGRYVEDVIGGMGHAPSDKGRCKVFWFGPAPSAADIRSTIETLEPWQVAVCIQSFMPIDMATRRAVFAV